LNSNDPNALLVIEDETIRKRCMDKGITAEGLVAFVVDPLLRHLDLYMMSWKMSYLPLLWFQQMLLTKVQLTCGRE
jgi:hypothetical protein